VRRDYAALPGKTEVLGPQRFAHRRMVSAKHRDAGELYL
jgi:hypothetical protein